MMKMEYPLTEHRVTEIFTKVKLKSTSSVNEDNLNYEEVEVAFQYLVDHLVDTTLFLLDIGKA